jgi:hypothetical protein
MPRRWWLVVLAPIFVVLAACSSTPLSAPTTTTTTSPDVRIVLRTGQSCPDAVKWIDGLIATRETLPPGSTTIVLISCTAKELTTALRSLHPRAAATISGMVVSATTEVCPTQPTLKLCASGGWSKTITAG